MTKTISSVLITGANAGLGYDAAKQIALKEGVTRVILACRNPDRAAAAKKNLEDETKKQVFEVLIMEVSNLESVKKAVEELKGPVDGLILNAGGFGGATPAKMTEYGVPDIFAVNVLGHAYLVDLLLQQKKLSTDASVIYAGSEAARGVPSFGMTKPELKSGSIEEFTSICDSSFFGDTKTVDSMYGTVKLVAAFWMSSMARKQPQMRFITMSPGGTNGTAFTSESPWYTKLQFAIMFPIAEFFGQIHSLDKGTQRYMDALYQDDLYKSGVFYGSKKGVTGEVVDQVIFTPELSDKSYQDNADTAVHKFIK